jgi:hypothetical protein
MPQYGRGPGVGMMSRHSGLSNTVLLTDVPQVLHDRNRLRTLLVEVAGVRQIQFATPPPRIHRGVTGTVGGMDSNTTTTSQTTTLTNFSDAFVVEKDSASAQLPLTALVTMTHPDGAAKVVVAIRHFAAILSKEIGTATSTEEKENITQDAGTAHDQDKEDMENNAAAAASKMAAHWVPVQPNLSPTSGNCGGECYGGRCGQ